MQAWCLRFSPALEKRAGGLSEVTGYRVASCLSNQRPSHRNQKWVDDITGAGEGLKRRPSPASPSRCRLRHSCLPWQRKIQAISKSFTATDAKHAKENTKGKFPSFFASFATFAVKQVWLMAEC